MPVTANEAGRLDIGLARGARFAWAARWTRSRDGGKTYDPVDLTGWDCRVRLYDDMGDLLLDKPCETYADGIATAVVEASDTNDDVWDGRSQGTWRIIAGQSSGEALSCTWTGMANGSESVLNVIPDLDSGQVELLAWGYWRID